MFVVIPRCTMITEQWSIHGNFCYGGLLRGSVVPAKISCLTRCMRKRRRSTRWLCYGLVDRARCVSRDVTLHRLSVLIRFVDNSPLDSRLHLNASHAKECLTHHPCTELVTVGCLCQCCTHKSSFTLSSYFAHFLFGKWKPKTQTKNFKNPFFEILKSNFET